MSEKPKRACKRRSDGTRKFYQVFQGEITSVNARRRKLNGERGSRRPQITLVDEQVDEATGAPEKDNEGNRVLRPDDGAAVIGICLSGGGIRSAAFCLGALQALDAAGALDSMDYLSTVSGGGYIGSAMSAGMTASGKFPFKSTLTQDETPSLQHIRNYTNYLFPNGARDLFRNAAIYARGPAANAIVVLPILLAAAVATIFLNPTVESLHRPGIFGLTAIFGHPVPATFGIFTIAGCLGLLLLFVLAVWAVARSAAPPGYAEDTVRYSWAVDVLVALLAVAFLCELQPYVLDAMAHPASDWGKQLDRLPKIAAILAPLSAIVGLLSRWIGGVLTSTLGSAAWHQRLKRWLLLGVIWIAALVAPLILWVVYLKLSLWGVRQSDGTVPAPQWLQAASSVAGHSISTLYILVALGLWLISLLLQPNANSLNPLYRARLAKTFLFKPSDRSPAPDKDLEPFRPKLTGLSATETPYHILNCALNVQASKVSNRHGRNADFFSFSRDFVGSRATGYVRTGELQEIMPELDLAMAMAVSGAAFSPDMGAATVKPLTPTLALLNLRTGLWLRNPRRVARDRRRHWLARTHNVLANYYYLAEAFGRLN
jgi:Patatin-like phospholipase